MDKAVRLIEVIEVRTLDGKPLLSLTVSDKEVVLRDLRDKNSNQGADTKGERNQTGSQQNNDSPMTDAQKRYLFRILADQGTEGDKANEYLRKLFQVEALKDVTKFEASRMIERLLSETKGGEVDDPAPFQ